MSPGASSFVIRPAGFADLAALTAVDAQCFPPGIAYPTEEIAALFVAPNSLTLIAEQSSTILGFATAHLLPRRLPYRQLLGELVTIDVLPAYRREHVGWRLYQALETWLRGKEVTRVQLHVAVNNAAAMHFYQRLGFHSTTRVAGYYMGRLDAWKMEKMLDSARGSAELAGI